MPSNCTVANLNSRKRTRKMGASSSSEAFRYTFLECCDIMKPKKLRIGDDAVSLDRISSLSDDLLTDIISYLPTKDAAVASALSRQWRCRWRHALDLITRLDFDDSPIDHCSDSLNLIDDFPKFVRFVDNVLKNCHSENITYYRLHFGKGECHSELARCNEGCYPQLGSQHLNAWMSFPLSRGVTQLDICAHVREPGKLPCALFGCQTLEVLKLHVNLELVLPTSLSFPNLKELHLTLLNFPKDNDSVCRLVSSCPSLEHLELFGHWHPFYPINISSPSLRRLVMTFPNWYGSLRSNLVLDVPNLEYLKYGDTYPLCFSVKNMNALVEAHFTIIHDRKDCCQNILGLVRLLSNVKRMFLNGGCVQALMGSHLNDNLSVFRNLNHLALGCYLLVHYKVLMELLRCAPLLETLSFPEGIKGFSAKVQRSITKKVEHECQLWCANQTVPSCVGFHLRSIVIKRYEHTNFEIDVVKYFLKNASVLKELAVICHTSVAVAERKSVESTLQKLPRGSMTCSIEVQ